MIDVTRIVEYKKEIEAIDLAEISKHANNTRWLLDYSDYYYRLLALLSTQFNDQVLFDVGTFEGNSALTLSYGNNKVVSYDVGDYRNLKSSPPNIEFVIGDFRNDERLMSSPLIYIDVSPHDGIQEKEFHEFFVKSGYKGIIVWDDIHFGQGMKNWWDNINDQNVLKLDVTSVGHHSGTGITIYS